MKKTKDTKKNSNPPPEQAPEKKIHPKEREKLAQEKKLQEKNAKKRQPEPKAKEAPKEKPDSAQKTARQNPLHPTEPKGFRQHKPEKKDPPKKTEVLMSKLPEQMQIESLKSKIPEEEWKQYKMIAMMVFVAVLCGVSFSLLQYLNYQDSYVQSVLYLDINPSFSVSLNQHQQVTEITPLNEEAIAVLGNSDMTDMSVDEAMSSLLALLHVHGYLIGSTTILATVEDSEQSRGEPFSVEVKEMLDMHLIGYDSDITTVGLWVDPQLDYALKAEELGVPMGKYVLLDELAQVNYFFQMDTLMPYSYGELYQLYASGESVAPIGLDAVMELGKYAVSLTDFDQFALEITPRLLEETPQYELLFQTATMEYTLKVHAYEGTTFDILQRQTTNDIIGIFPNKAKELALAHVNKLELQVEQLQVKQDWSKGILQYYVSFQEQDMQHNLVIMSTTGEIVLYYTSSVSPEAVTDLGQTLIQDLVFEDAGITRNQLTSNTFQRNVIDGVMIYEMDFSVKNRQFYYEVTGNGTILHSQHIDTGTTEEIEEPEEEVLPALSETTAKDLALSHAGVVFSQVTELTATEVSGGDYEIQFILEDWLYSYLISAEKHEVQSYEKTVAPNSTLLNYSGDIGMEQAKLLALSHANLKEVMIQSFDLSEEGSGAEKSYHILFSFGNYNFIYEISASGEVLHSDQQFIPMVTEPEAEEEAPPEPDTQPSQDDFEQMMENFNSTLQEFDNNMNSLW